MRRRYLLLALSLTLGVAWAASSASPASKSLNDVRTQIEESLRIPNPLPDLRAKSYGQFPVTHDIAADRVSYQTNYNLRVPAIVYHSAGATVVQHPAIVIVNHSGEDKSSPRTYYAGILYARAGAVVLTYDPIGQYERNSTRHSGDQPTVPNNLSAQMDGLTVTDILQAIEYLRTRKDVDPKNIAVLASSTGSIACALDPTIHACVLPDNANLPIAKRGPTLISQDFLSRTVALWLNDKLKFPNWNKKQILAMPETELDGQKALGEIPPMAREDLHALPLPVWEAEKDFYIFESWLERATQEATQKSLQAR